MSLPANAAARLSALEDENETLREENAQLRKILSGESNVPPELGLSKQQRRIFSVLARFQIADNDRLLSALYFDNDDGGPDYARKVLNVQIFRMREKLAAHGYSIKNRFGVGYTMTRAA